MTIIIERRINNLISYPCVWKRISCNATTVASPHDATTNSLRSPCSSTRWITGTSSTSATAAAWSCSFILLDNIVETHVYFINHLHLCWISYNDTATRKWMKPTSFVFVMMATNEDETIAHRSLGINDRNSQNDFLEPLRMWFVDQGGLYREINEIK